jgi:hypothetical protein
MSYIHKFESFRKQKAEVVNEEILGTLFNWAKGYINKKRAAERKVKGAKDLDVIYNKFLKMINDQLASQAKISLNLKGEQELLAAANKPQQKPAVKTAESLMITEGEDQAPVIEEGEEGEEDAKDTKLDVDTLRQKMSVITKIIDIQKKNAKKEMTKVLQKYGGAEKNPDLKELIDTRIDEFDLALLNAQMDYLNQAGDKEAIKKVTANRDKKQKEIQASYAKIGTDATKEIKVGDKTLMLGKKYRYKTANGVKTIVIKGEAEGEEGKVKAAYTFGDTKDQEQLFTAANVDTEFKPVKGNKYGYFSQNNDKVIEVTVTADPDANGMVAVKTGKNEFNVEVGSLLDKEEEGQGA